MMSTRHMLDPHHQSILGLLREHDGQLRGTVEVLAAQLDMPPRVFRAGLLVLGYYGWLTMSFEASPLLTIRRIRPEVVATDDP